MEEWKEVFVGKIPKGNYQIQMTNGEENGLVIELKDSNILIVLNFGMIQAIRMLDEGIVQNELYLNSEVERFRKDGFKNVIYEVANGEFLKQILNVSGGYLEACDLKHYVIVTQNYNVDIITEWKPEIKAQ